MRKQEFCLCENKGADQFRNNCQADQHLCFHFMDSTIPLLPKSEISSFFCSCTGRFVMDLVGKLEDPFSRVSAHISSFDLNLTTFNFSCNIISRSSEVRWLSSKI